MSEIQDLAEEVFYNRRVIERVRRLAEELGAQAVAVEHGTQGEDLIPPTDIYRSLEGELWRILEAD